MNMPISNLRFGSQLRYEMPKGLMDSPKHGTVSQMAETLAKCVDDAARAIPLDKDSYKNRFAVRTDKNGVDVFCEDANDTLFTHALLEGAFAYRMLLNNNRRRPDGEPVNGSRIGKAKPEKSQLWPVSDTDVKTVRALTSQTDFDTALFAFRAQHPEGWIKKLDIN